MNKRNSGEVDSIGITMKVGSNWTYIFDKLSAMPAFLREHTGQREK